MKRVLSLLLCLVLLVGVLPLAAHAVTTIDKVSVTLAYPEAGETPPTASCNGSGYSIYAIDWYDCDTNQYLDSGDKIQADHQYEATIWVEAGSGYEFNCVNDRTPNISATVNGEKVTVTKAYEYKAWAMVNLTYYFSSVPAEGWIKSVDLSIPAPVTGEKPIYYQISGNSYKLGNVYFNDKTNEKMQNGIAWYPTATGDWMTPNTAVFDANTAYTFHCLILPSEGYRFTRNAVVRVNGKTAETSLDYDHFLSVAFDFPATGTAHVHTPSEWRTTQAYHYTVCTTCGEMLEQEDHLGGVSSCAEPMVCSVCGYAYKEPHENHTPDTSKWIARVDMYHFHACMFCGAHCDIEDHTWSPRYHVVDAGGHAYQCAVCKGYDTVHPHNPGPEATDTEPQTCKDCGYIIAPAKNHTHNLTKVEQIPATCTEDGTIEHYTCDGCSEFFADAEGKNPISDPASMVLVALGHEQLGDWCVDADNHWKGCIRCAAVLNGDKQPHEDADGDGKCDVCLYAPGTAVPEGPAKPQDPGTTGPITQPGQDQDEDPPRKLSWLPIVLVVLVCFAAAVTVTVIILKKKQGEKK